MIKVALLTDTRPSSKEILSIIPTSGEEGTGDPEYEYQPSDPNSLEDIPLSNVKRG